MLILTKCSQARAKKMAFLFFTGILLFFISGSFLTRGEIVEFNGETPPENLTDEVEPAAGDQLSGQEARDKFLEEMKEKLKNLPEASNDDKSSNIPKAPPQKGEGLLTKCSFRVGEKTCGKCYCLKANPPSQIVFNGRKLRGCARLDISLVDDLEALVGQVVYYEGTSEFNSSVICPRNFKLFTVKPVEGKNEDF